MERQLDLSQFSSADANVNAPPASTSIEEESVTAAANSNNQPTLHVISQEGLRLEDEKMDANVQYVEYIKEGQQIRLPVPINADPIEYAKECLEDEILT